MNMRIPFEISAKGMQGGNHPEYLLIFKVTIKIAIIFVVSDFACFTVLSLLLAIDILIEHFTDSVAGSDEKIIQGSSVFAEEEPVVFGDRKYNVTM